jgi:hypothetical protein
MPILECVILKLFCYTRKLVIKLNLKTMLVNGGRITVFLHLVGAHLVIMMQRPSTLSPSTRGI